MRVLRLTLPALGVLGVLVPASGHADPYRWCAQYGARGGGGTNCGFHHAGAMPSDCERHRRLLRA